MAESTKKKGKRAIRETPELPEDITTDILTCLPVKSLLRFRSVSKPFRALIDSPDFIKRHLNHSLLSKFNHKLFLKGVSNKSGSPARLYSVDLDLLDQALEIDHPFGTDILGSVNGLLCLQNRDEDIFFWNFATRTYHKLPVSVSEVDSSGHPCASTYGFGYDSVSDDYKLFQHFLYITGDDSDSCYSEAKVYSLRSNSWQSIQDFPLDIHNGKACKVLVCGALHWITSHSHDSDDTFIAAFDLTTNGFRVVDHPEFLTEGPDNVTKLVGRLCVPCFFSERVDLWVMNDYGVKESWSKLFSVSQPRIISKFFSAVSLAYLKSGTEIMLLPDYRKLIWYSLKEGTMRTIHLRGYPDRSILQVCVESLVPLSEKAEDFTNIKDGTRKRGREKGGRSR